MSGCSGLCLQAVGLVLDKEYVRWARVDVYCSDETGLGFAVRNGVWKTDICEIGVVIEGVFEM